MTDKEAIESALATHVAAVNAGNLTANLATFTEDIVYLSPDTPAIRGRESLEAFMRTALDAFAPQIEMTAEETIVAGDWAFQWGRIAGELRPLGGGNSAPFEGHWLYVYRREADGSWKIARDIYNARNT